RQDIIIYKSKHSNITNVKLVDWVKKEFKLDVHPSTIGHLLKIKKKSKIILLQKDKEPSNIQNLKYITQVGSTKSRKSNFKQSNSDRKSKSFCSNIKKHREDASVDNAIVAAIIPKLKELLKEYDLKDIYNINKTRLFYNFEPDTTLVTKCFKEKKRFRVINLGTLLGVKYDARILPNTQDNKESFIDDNDNELMDKLYTDIEALNFPNLMDLEEYIDYPREKDTYEVLSNKKILDLATNLEFDNKNVKDNNSTEMRQISHQEALNAVEILEQYHAE
ncbi:23989_t:CDS:2, partial [Gigaspora margarita]